MRICADRVSFKKSGDKKKKKKKNLPPPTTLPTSTQTVLPDYLFYVLASETRTKKKRLVFAGPRTKQPGRTQRISSRPHFIRVLQSSGSHVTL